MIKVQVLNVVFEGVNPLDQLIRLIIMVEDLVNFRLIQINTLLDNVNLVESFKVNGLNLFDKIGPFGISFQSE